MKNRNKVVPIFYLNSDRYHERLVVTITKYAI